MSREISKVSDRASAALLEVLRSASASGAMGVPAVDHHAAKAARDAALRTGGRRTCHRLRLPPPHLLTTLPAPSRDGWADGVSADSRSRWPGRIGLGGERTTRRGRGGRQRVPGGIRRSPSTSSSYGSRTPVSPPATTSRRPPPLSSPQVLGRRSPGGVEHPPGRSAASMAGSSSGARAAPAKPSTAP